MEQTPLSVWMRQDDYAHFLALIFHAYGMALLVGGGLAVCLGMLGLARAPELHRYCGFFPTMWVGALLAVVSGLLLLAGYPAKALTNPLFPVKFACLIAASFLLRAAAIRLFPASARGETPPPQGRLLAAASLILWFAGVAAGKLLLHTATILTVS